MFAYCNNNPVNYSDSSGTFGEWARKLGGIVAATVAAAVCVAAFVTLAPAVICAATCSLGLLGLGAAAAETIATVATIVVAADVTLYTMDEAYSTVTGDSPVLDAMGHDHETYEAWRMASHVEGTQVQTENGIVPIEEIRPGDKVWAWDEETGEVALKPVLETYINECDELIHLSVNREIITCTPNHPFYVPQKGWTKAVHLRAGDILVLLNGEYVVLEKVQHELLESPVIVYNFQVEDYHTYYVGESSIRVHNDKCGIKRGSPTVPDGAECVRSDTRNVKSEFFRDFIRAQGRSFRNSEWKYKMETWYLPDGTIVERHYWHNSKSGESYYHD